MDGWGGWVSSRPGLFVAPALRRAEGRKAERDSGRVPRWEMYIFSTLVVVET